MAEGRRFAIQCRLQTYTDCGTPNQRFWSGTSTLTPSGRGRGQESEFPSAFCLLPSAFLVNTAQTALNKLAAKPGEDRDHLTREQCDFVRQPQKSAIAKNYSKYSKIFITALTVLTLDK